MCQPEGFGVRKGENFYCLLQKSLYGLKQAPRNWNTCFSEFLLSYNLVASASYACFYIRRNEKQKVELILALYVDDGLVCGPNKELIREFVGNLRNKFECSFGEPKIFLGLDIKRYRQDKQLAISQPAYISKTLEV